MLSHPNLFKNVLYTDASDLKLGAVILQEGHPISYHSRKLNLGQRRYTATEKYLLSIVKTLEEFDYFVRVQDIGTYRSYKSRTQNIFNVVRLRHTMENDY